MKKAVKRIFKIALSPLAIAGVIVYWILLAVVCGLGGLYELYAEEFDRINGWVVKKIGRG